MDPNAACICVDAGEREWRYGWADDEGSQGVGRDRAGFAEAGPGEWRNSLASFEVLEATPAEHPCLSRASGTTAEERAAMAKSCLTTSTSRCVVCGLTTQPCTMRARTPVCWLMWASARRSCSPCTAATQRSTPQPYYRSAAARSKTRGRRRAATASSSLRLSAPARQPCAGARGSASHGSAVRRERSRRAAREHRARRRRHAPPRLRSASLPSSVLTARGQRALDAVRHCERRPAHLGVDGRFSAVRRAFCAHAVRFARRVCRRAVSFTPAPPPSPAAISTNRSTRTRSRGGPRRKHKRSPGGRLRGSAHLSHQPRVVAAGGTRCARSSAIGSGCSSAASFLACTIACCAAICSGWRRAVEARRRLSMTREAAALAAAGGNAGRAGGAISLVGEGPRSGEMTRVPCTTTSAHLRRAVS